MAPKHKAKLEQEERAIICSDTVKRPYSAEILIQVLDPPGLETLEKSTILFKSGSFATITPKDKTPWDKGKPLSIKLLGFAKASEAEENATRLTQALLFTAIKLNIGLSLIYLSHDPFSIYNRNISPGISMFATGYVGININKFLEYMIDTYQQSKVLDQKYLISMEIYCSAIFERFERPYFLNIVSSLEPLATQQDLDPSVNRYIDFCLTELKNHNIPTELVNSLKGRVGSMRKESVRQSIKRLVDKTIPEIPNAFNILDDAYNLRSQIIHTGKPNDLDLNLREEGKKVANILKTLYSKELEVS